MMKINPLLLTLAFLFSGCQKYVKELDAHRVKYKDGFTHDPRSPLKIEDLTSLDFFPANKDWKLKCTCEAAQNAKPFELPTYSGITRTYILHSIASCPNKGKILKFEIYKNLTQPVNPLYKDNLFLPFKDLTNGEETYGGGRYINLYSYDIKDNQIIIDLNKCYNPWCAYSAGYNCPIPPKANHLDVAVEAGEKTFKGEYKGDKH